MLPHCLPALRDAGRPADNTVVLTLRTARAQETPQTHYSTHCTPDFTRIRTRTINAHQSTPAHKAYQTTRACVQTPHDSAPAHIVYQTTLTNTTTAYSLRGRRSGLAVTFKGDTKAVIRCSKTTLKLEMSGTPRPRFITVYDTHSGPCKAHVVSDLTCSFMEVANGLIELLKVRSTLTLTLTLSHSHLVLCE